MTRHRNHGKKRIRKCATALLTMTFILSGCGSAETTTDNSQTETVASSEEVTTVATTEPTTEVITESEIQKPELTIEEAKCRDLQTAAMLYVTVMDTLMEPDAFDSIATIAGESGFMIVPEGNPYGSDFSYLIPEGKDIDTFLNKFETNLGDKPLPIYYYDMEWQPTCWGVYVDKDFNVEIDATTAEGKAISVYPTINSIYQYASQSAKKNKADDVVSAAEISAALSKSLANEDAYDEIYDYSFKQDEILATARPGEPFRSAVDSPLDNFLREMNTNMGGNAPVMRYVESVKGWVPTEWGIAVLDSKPWVKVFITDGTKENKVEVYPDFDQIYK